jgi:hypothetical protein
MLRTYITHPEDLPWMQEVARDLNTLQARADFIEEDPHIADVDVEVVSAIRRVCERVAQFEDIHPA